MRLLRLHSNEDKRQREVTYKGKVIKAFSYYDDFAYTKAMEFMEMSQKMTDDEFKENWPEFFL
jgi:alkyl hydroperoxide reductase subunit AhpC